MDLSTPTVSPLRQRMLDDMRMRKLAGKTQVAYPLNGSAAIIDTYLPLESP